MIPEQFRIWEQDGDQLILPEIGVGNNAWKDWNHRWLRSLHVDANQRIVSVGFPKFVNLNEGNGRYHVSEQILLQRAGKDLWATLKVDGSLLIRYVRDGEVKFRTRGSFGVFLDNSFEIQDFCKNHPLLADPSYHPDDSLLFEWVSPRLPIVIRYDVPQLFVIGAVRYRKDCAWHCADPELFLLDELKKISEETGISLVDYYPLKTPQEVLKLIEDLKGEKEKEGFVLRFGGEQELVKVKSAHFLILHALKSNLTTVKLIELWQSWEEPDFEAFGEKFQAVYDYECWLWALPAVSSMFDGIRVVRKIIGHVKEFVDDCRHLDRRAFALEAQSRFNQLRLSLCFLFWDGKAIPESLVQKLILQNCKQVEKRMFEADE